MTLKFAAAVMAGFVSHQARPFLLRFAHGWRDLLLYALGVIGAAPFVALFHDELPSLPARRRFLISYFLGFGAYGFGVLLGWLHDSARESN